MSDFLTALLSLMFKYATCEKDDKKILRMYTT